MFEHEVALKRAEQEKFKTSARLWEDGDFQLWVETIRVELKTLKSLEWQVGFSPSARQQGVLDQLGLRIPTSYEELLMTFTAFRAVVNFYERKLKTLESSAERFRTIEKELHSIPD